MAELKREYVVPLRRKTLTAPKWRRSKKAVSVLKEFIMKHMKTDNVIICSELNEAIWSRGIKHPPGKVSVVALKTQIGGVEKTLVNLAEVGLEAQQELYASQAVEMPVQEEAQAEEVKDAEVKEVKKEEASEETKTEEEPKKEEVKKDE